MRADELRPGAMRSIGIAGRRVLVCNVAGALHAVEDRCSHANVPLGGGTLRGCVLQCPLHGGRFDVRNGRVVQPPPRKPLAAWSVEVADGYLVLTRRSEPPPPR